MMKVKYFEGGEMEMVLQEIQVFVEFVSKGKTGKLSW